MTQQLGLDMLKVGGGTSEQIAEVMLSNGDVIEALKWHKIENNYEFKCKKDGVGNRLSVLFTKVIIFQVFTYT